MNSWAQNPCNVLHAFLKWDTRICSLLSLVLLHIILLLFSIIIFLLLPSLSCKTTVRSSIWVPGKGIYLLSCGSLTCSGQSNENYVCCGRQNKIIYNCQTKTHHHVTIPWYDMLLPSNLPIFRTIRIFGVLFYQNLIKNKCSKLLYTSSCLSSQQQKQWNKYISLLFLLLEETENPG